MLLLGGLLFGLLLFAKLTLLLVDESLADLLGPTVVDLVIFDKSSDCLPAVVDLRHLNQQRDDIE
jgi:hypothetical protein